MNSECVILVIWWWWAKIVNTTTMYVDFFDNRHLVVGNDLLIRFGWIYGKSCSSITIQPAKKKLLNRN